MTAYMLAHDVPGIRLFPEQSGELETSYRVDTRQDPLVRKIATRRRPADLSFATTIVDDFRETLSDVIDVPANSIPEFS